MKLTPWTCWVWCGLVRTSWRGPTTLPGGTSSACICGYSLSTHLPGGFTSNWRPVLTLFSYVTPCTPGHSCRRWCTTAATVVFDEDCRVKYSCEAALLRLLSRCCQLKCCCQLKAAITSKLPSSLSYFVSCQLQLAQTLSPQHSLEATSIPCCYCFVQWDSDAVNHPGQDLQLLGPGGEVFLHHLQP